MQPLACLDYPDDSWLDPALEVGVFNRINLGGMVYRGSYVCTMKILQDL